MYYNSQAFEHRYTSAIKINLHNDKKLFIIKRACKLLRNFDNYTQSNIIKNWSQQFNITEKLLRHYIHSNDVYELSASEQLKEYLANYEIKINDISKEIFVYKNKERITLQELYFFANEKNYKTKNLKLFLNPENTKISVVKKFNPLKDFFLQLADEYNGENTIKLLTNNLTTYNFDNERLTEHYQKRMHRYIHKWLCKVVAQTFEYTINDAMLLFIEVVGGKGKSRLTKWLFSLPELKNYFHRIKDLTDYNSLNKLNNQKLVIDYDELPLSKIKYQAFKGTIASEDNNFYDKKSQKFTSTFRQINFIGSTNKGNRNGHKGFILDNDSAFMRRVIPIELTAINWQKYTKEVDLRQLWAQAVHDVMLAKKNNNTDLLLWNEKDWADMRAENKKYMNFEIKDLLFVYISPAEKSKGKLMSSSEILKFLKSKGKNINSTADSLGRLLASNGFKRSFKSKGRGWWVKINI